MFHWEIPLRNNIHSKLMKWILSILRNAEYLLRTFCSHRPWWERTRLRERDWTEIASWKSNTSNLRTLPLVASAKLEYYKTIWRLTFKNDMSQHETVCNIYGNVGKCHAAIVHRSLMQERINCWVKSLFVFFFVFLHTKYILVAS